MADSEIPYPFLDSDIERQWLVNVLPEFVRDNAHRIYEVMVDAGIGAESFIRELAFTKAIHTVGPDFTPVVDRQRLYGWADWTPGSARTIRALLFGEMVKRAKPVVKEYPSDLYHDAVWITENVNGPTEFWWMVRHSGTNVAEYAVTQESIESGGSRVLYHVALTDEDGQWYATFSEYVRVKA
jgi:hypothetical protein